MYQSFARGGLPSGFELNALLNLRNMINLDHQVYKYYGSETSPPCSETVQWFVFAKPRSVTRQQGEFLKAQLGRKKGWLELK